LGAKEEEEENSVLLQKIFFLRLIIKVWCSDCSSEFKKKKKGVFTFYVFEFATNKE
jgi:hypothetical protein